MKAISIRSVLLLISFWALTTGMLLAQDAGKYFSVGGYVTPGASILRIGDVSAVANPEDFSAAVGAGLNLGVNFRYKPGILGFGAALEYGTFRNNLNLDWNRTQGVVNGGYVLSNGTATPLDTFTLASDVRAEQGLNVNSFGLSLFGDYQLTEDNGAGYWFVEAGIKLTGFFGSDRINTGNSSFAGDFSSAFQDKIQDGDEIEVIVDNALPFGFGSDTVQGSQSTLDNLSFTPSFYLHPAYTFRLGSSGDNRLSFGPVIQFNLGSIFTQGASQLDDLREGDFSYKRPSLELSSAGFTFLGVRASFFKDIRGKECFDLDTLGVNLEPSLVSLANDPEFKFIQNKLNANLRVKGIMEPNGLPGADGSIVFNSCKTSPNNLKPYFEEDEEGISIQSAFPLPGKYNITVDVGEDVYPRNLQINVKDNRGEEVRNFVTEIVFQGATRQKQKMNSGESVSKLYSYAGLPSYAVKVSHPCHELGNKSISLADNGSNDAVLDFVLQPSGKVKQIQVPFESAPSMSLTEVIDLGGELKIGANAGEVNGASFQNGILTLQGGCNLAGELNSATSLSIKKRKGYDLVLGNNAGDWQSKSLEVPLQNGSATEKIKEVPLKVVHLVYVDVSYLEERGILLDTVENIMKSLKDLGANEVYTAVGGQAPVEAKKYSDIEGSFLESVATLDPNRVPKPLSVLSGFQSVLKKEKIRSDRRKFYLTFYLSRTIYGQSKEIIIGDYLKYLGEEGAPAGIRIITEKEVPANQKWAPTGYDSKLIEYNDLGSQ